MKWRVDDIATRAAEDLFRGYKPQVQTNGHQYIIAPTPYGRIELVPIGGKFLVAAESPPGGARLDPSVLSGDLASHLKDNHLHPWRIVRGRRILSVLPELARTASPKEEEPESTAWSPYVRDPGKARKVIGQARKTLVRKLAGLVVSQLPGCPVPALAGPFGVGKHTLALAAADLLELLPVELPLGRLLGNRMLATPQEMLLDTILAGTPFLTGCASLLILSDAELLARLPQRDRFQALLELGRLPHVLLLATVEDASTVEMPQVIGITCPGLKGHAETLELLKTEQPDLRPVDSAIRAICRESRVQGVGIVPARLLFLARLGHTILDPDNPSRNQDLFPDDASAAIGVARRAWQETREERKQ